MKSHVISTSLHLDAQGTSGENQHVIYSGSDYPRRNWTGIYGGFVCGPCAKLFHPWAEHGIEFVRKYCRGNRGARLNGDFANGFRAEVDYERLKLWIMSTLWRADACDHVFYKRVDLGGKWRKRLSEGIRQRDPGPPYYFAVTATLFPMDVGLMNPHGEKIGGITYCRFYIYRGFTFLR